MCIAILKKAGATITNTMLRHCFMNNKDGAGFAYSREGKLVIIRGLMTIEAFLESFREHEANNPSANFMLHFRIGTSGKNDESNTHPFQGAECAVAHNGVLCQVPTSEDKSDTHLVISHAPELLTKKNVLAKLESISSFIGIGNKLIFLFEDGEYAIANEKQGYWVGDIWYSNYGHYQGGQKERDILKAGGTP